MDSIKTKSSAARIMSDGSIISIPDSETSIHTVIEDAETVTTNSGDQSPSTQQFHACALYLNHWSDGTIKEGTDLRSAKKTYVEGLKEKPAETSTIIFEKSCTEDKMDGKRFKLSKSSVSTNRGDDASRKENAVDCSVDLVTKMSRRSTILLNIAKESPTVASKGRRQTIFIEALDAPRAKPRQVTASLEKDSKKGKKISPSTTNNIAKVEANRVVMQPNQSSSTKHKLNSPPLTSKNNFNSSHRENHRSSSSSTSSSIHRTSLPVPSTHRVESSTQLKATSLTKGTESQRTSLSSETSVKIRSPNSMEHKHRKRKHPKDSHSNYEEKKRRLSGNESNVHSKATEAKQASNGDMRKSLLHELDGGDDSDDSLNLLVPMGYSDEPKLIVRDIMKTKSTKPSSLSSAEILTTKNHSKNTKRNRVGKNVATKSSNHASAHPSNVKETDPKSSLQSKKQKIIAKILLDPAMNPTVLVHRLKINPLKRRSDGKIELNVMDDKYAAYDVNGVFKIKKKKRKNRPQSQSALSQIVETKEDKAKEDKAKEDKAKEDKAKEDKAKEDKAKEDKAKEAANKKSPVVTRNFSQQTKSVSACDIEKTVATRNVSQQTKNVCTRDIGVQKNDKEIDTLTKKHAESIALFTQSVQEYDTAVCEQQQTISALKESIKEQKDNVSERESKIAERERMIVERDLKIAERDRMISERDKKLEERDAKILQLEEKVKLQESRIQWMGVQVNTLKRSEKSLTDSLNDLVEKCKEYNIEKPMSSKSSILATALQNGANTHSPIRVRNIDQLRDNSLPNGHTTNNQQMSTIVPSNQTNVIQTSNVVGWTADAMEHQNSNNMFQPLQQQQAYIKATQYAQTVVSPPMRYVCMQQQQQTQSTTTTEPTAQQNSVPSIVTPHQNLPRIIQKSTRPMPIRSRRASNAPTVTSSSNNAFDLNIGITQQRGTMEDRSHASSQIRNRAKTSFYSAQQLPDGGFNVNVALYRRNLQLRQNLREQQQQEELQQQPSASQLNLSNNANVYLNMQ